MNRRSMLVSVAAVVAGCTGGQNATTSDRPRATRTPTATAAASRTSTPPPTAHRPDRARERLEAARAHLKTASREFQAELDRVEYTSSAPRFDEAPVDTALQKAREDLRAAGEVASPAQKRTVTALERYTAFLEGLLATMDLFVTSLERRQRAITYENNQQYGEAVAYLERAKQALDTARTRLDEARAAFQEAQESLRNPQTVALADADSSLERLSELLAGFSTVYDGDVKFERGYREFDAGVMNFENGDYTLAQSSFSEAESRFLQAENIYTEGEAGAPSELLDLILRRQCQSDKYARAAAEMNKASAVADTDPRKANEHIDAAQAAMNETC